MKGFKSFICYICFLTKINVLICLGNTSIISFFMSFVNNLFNNILHRCFVLFFTFLKIDCYRIYKIKSLWNTTMYFSKCITPTRRLLLKSCCCFYLLYFLSRHCCYFRVCLHLESQSQTLLYFSLLVCMKKVCSRICISSFREFVSLEQF